MSYLSKYIQHDWPVHFLLWLTNWLPDNVICLKIRGFLITPFLGTAGKGLYIARNVVLQNPEHIRLGDNVYIGIGTCILATGKIHIQSNVQIAPYCVIVSADHVRLHGSYANHELLAKPITIGEGSWLGAHVTITAGSSIGEGSCVGAGSVVHGQFQNSCLIAGVPAKVKKVFSD